MPQFDPSFFLSQIFWLVVCFFILVGFMGIVVVPRLKESLQNRSDYIQGITDKKESYYQEISELSEKLSYLKLQQDQQAKQLLDGVHQKINQEKEKQLAELHTKFLQARQSLNAELTDEIKKIREILPEISKDLAKEFMQEVLKEDKDKGGSNKAKKHAHS